jgi:NB-ARC domain
MRKNSLSMRLSDAGEEVVERARSLKGWLRNDDRWLQTATEQANPVPREGWPAYWESNPYSTFSPSDATLKRFLQQRPVKRKFFLALCAAIEVDGHAVVDWEKPIAPLGVDPFFGRTRIICDLQQRLEPQNCRLIWLYGRAGIGKTSLVNHLVNQVQQRVKSQFEAFVQLSLETGMALPELINQLLASLSKGEIQQGDLRDLQHYLKRHRCLVILDQWEVLFAYNSIEQYQSDYEDYQDLLKVLGSRHQSTCIVLCRHQLSRLLAKTIGNTLYSLELGGLCYEEDAAILAAAGLVGTEAELRRFIGIYHNPLILQLIAETIRTVHQGKVAPFVGTGTLPITPDIARVIQAEFKALSGLEQEVVYWLAIWRDPIEFAQLQQSFKPEIGIAQLSDAVQTLIGKRSFVKCTEKSEFYLEPVTLKEVTNLFVRQVAKELAAIIQSADRGAAKLIISHCFLIGDEDIQIEQQRRIVRSIVEQLQQRSPDRHLPMVLSNLQSWLTSGYAPQNIALLCASMNQPTA